MFKSQKNLSVRAGFTTVLAVLTMMIILGGIVGAYFYFKKPVSPKFTLEITKQPVVQSHSSSSSSVLPAQSRPTPTISVSSGQSFGDNSFDADGFLWGTEGGINILDVANLSSKIANIIKIINNTLQTQHIKVRLNVEGFSMTGDSFSPVFCLPSISKCLEKFDMDQTAKLFQQNGWSMFPMFTPYGNTSKVISESDITNYVNFVDWFVTRYKNTASIKYIELFNAPGLKCCTSAKLLDLSNKTYDRIKSKHPEVLVGTPGFEYWHALSAMTQSSPHAVYFLDPANNARFDFWAFHGYPTHSGSTWYPPTKTADANPFAGASGILEIRKRLDANGWQNRPIFDMEHTGVGVKGTLITDLEDATDAAYMAQELVIKKTLRINNVSALAGILPFKIRNRGNLYESLWGSLNSDGSLTRRVKAVALLLSKLNQYEYSSHVSGAFNNENQVWVKKFIQGANKELYIFFKPFKYKSGQSISLDNETLNYTLNLNKTPSKITLTDIDGKITNLSASQSTNLEAINSPKFLEVNF